MKKKASPLKMEDIISFIKESLKSPKVSIAPTAIGSLGGSGIGAGVGYLDDDMTVAEGALKGLGIGAGAGAGVTLGGISGALGGELMAPVKERFLDDLFTSLAYMGAGATVGAGAGAVGGGIAGKKLGDMAAEKYAAYEQGFMDKLAELDYNNPQLQTGDYSGNSLVNKYQGPSYLGNGLGQFAGNFNDDNKRANWFNRIAQQLQSMGQLQMAYAARGMEIPKK